MYYDEVTINVLDNEINILNVRKTTNYNNSDESKRSAKCTPTSSSINSSPENQHGFCRLKTVPGKNLYGDLVKDHKRNENNIINVRGSIANFDRDTEIKINNSVQSERSRFRNFPHATFALY